MNWVPMIALIPVQQGDLNFKGFPASYECGCRNGKILSFAIDHMMRSFCSVPAFDAIFVLHTHEPNLSFITSKCHH
jgi:hypothetical protein